MKWFDWCSVKKKTLVTHLPYNNFLPFDKIYHNIASHPSIYFDTHTVETALPQAYYETADGGMIYCYQYPQTPRPSTPYPQTPRPSTPYPHTPRPSTPYPAIAKQNYLQVSITVREKLKKAENVTSLRLQCICAGQASQHMASVKISEQKSDIPYTKSWR